MKTLFFWSCLLLCLSANSLLLAQDLHIHYDVQSDDIQYILDKKEVQQPSVRAGQMIYLHIDNYNNYLYEIEVQANSEQTAVAGAMESNLFGGGMLGENSLFSNLGSLSALIESNFQNITSGFPEGGRGELESEKDASEFQVLENDFLEIAQEANSTEKQLMGLLEDIENIQETHTVRTVVLEEMQKLKYNPLLTPDKIQELSLEYLRKALQIQDLSQFNLDALLDKASIRQQLGGKISQLDATYQQHQNQIMDLQEIVAAIQALEVDSSAVQPLQNTASRFNQNAMQIQQEVEQNREALQNYSEEIRSKELQQLAALRYEYEALAANDFSYTYRAEAEGDRVRFNITMRPKSDSAGNLSVQELAPITVPVRGGIKVNSSIGVGFGQFFEAPKTYSARNGIIIAEEESGFSPYLTSFVHFYAQSAGSVSWGGSFGLGFPLSGGNSLQSATFFLGSSLFIGRTERVVLTAGLLGGRTDELAQGFEEGDMFVSDADLVPTREVYQLGGFLGVSFNIIGN